MTEKLTAAPVARWRAGLPRPETIIAGVLAIAISIGAGVWAAPWVLPLRIVEGPYLQNTTETAATVLWWTIRPSQCELVVTVDRTERVLKTSERAWCNRVRVEGLAPGRSYPYRVRIGTRTLAEATLHTNSTGEQPVRFVVFGDSGRGSREQYALAARINEVRPEFVVHTGDLIYSAGERSNYRDRFFAPYAKLLAERNFWPSLGNHDVGGSEKAGPYRAVFELPPNGPEGLPAEDSYWFDYANLRIAVLDSNLPEVEIGARIAPWLDGVFAGAGERWRVVVFHHPPYSIAKHGCDARIQRALVPRFETLGVDIAFCGHDHVYSRTVPLVQSRPAGAGEEGIVYVVSGAGGAGLYDVRTEEKQEADRKPGDELALYPCARDDVHSFTSVEVSGDSMHLKQISVTGETLDDFVVPRIAAAAATQPMP